jgi:hypothetical protein
MTHYVADPGIVDSQDVDGVPVSPGRTLGDVALPHVYLACGTSPSSSSTTILVEIPTLSW